MAATFSDVIFMRVHKIELCKRDVGGRSLWSRTGRRSSEPYRRAVCPAVNNVALTLSDTFPAAFKKNASLFAAVRGRGCKAACHGGQTPLFDVCFNEDEPHLAKVHVHIARTSGSDSREEVLGLETMRHILQLSAVTCEEDSTSARSVTYTNNIALLVDGGIVGAGEWLIVPALACRCVRDGVFVQACDMSVPKHNDQACLS